MYPADRCWGTRECDPCSCGGDETKCDFYPEKRSKAMKKTEKLAPQTNIVWHKGSRLPKKMASTCAAKPLIICMMFSGSQPTCPTLMMILLGFIVPDFMGLTVNGVITKWTTSRGGLKSRRSVLEG